MLSSTGSVMSTFDIILPYIQPLAHLLADPTVTEVMVNAGGRRVFVERSGRLEEVSGLTLDEGTLKLRSRRSRNFAATKSPKSDRSLMGDTSRDTTLCGRGPSAHEAGAHIGRLAHPRALETRITDSNGSTKRRPGRRKCSRRPARETRHALAWLLAPCLRRPSLGSRRRGMDVDFRRPTQIVGLLEAEVLLSRAARAINLT